MSPKHDTPNEATLKSVYSLVKRMSTYESPYAICSTLILQEERVDEMECKSFIKCSDSNLLSVCRELVLRERPYSEATTQTVGGDCGVCFEARLHEGTVAVLDKLSAKCEL